MAYLPPMMIELAVYGLVSGLMINLIRTRKLYIDLYISLVIAMITGRIVAGIAKALIFAPGSFSMAVWTTSYFVTAWPGIVIQLALIPTLVIALMKARIIPERYPAGAAKV